jgi:hypothetical protein
MALAWGRVLSVARVVARNETMSPRPGTGDSVEASTETKSAGPSASAWTKKPPGSMPTCGLTAVTTTRSTAMSIAPSVASSTSWMLSPPTRPASTITPPS